MLFSFFSLACSSHVKKENDSADPAINNIDYKKSNYFASRSFSYLDMPDLSGDIEYPSFYYMDSDFYDFYELSPFDIISFFKQKKIISSKMKFSIIKVGRPVDSGDYAFVCSMLSVLPINNNYYKSSLEGDIAIYIITMGKGDILGAENLAKSNDLASKSKVSICYESLY